jgi:P27 family predicted phage terminase small subunit
MAGTSRSGRRRKPRAIRELEGSRTRPHHRAEPVYSPGVPAMPPMIADDVAARAKWDQLSARLSTSGVLTDAHGEMLTILCTAWADLERAREQFRSMNYQPLIVETIGEHRRVRPNPLVARIEKLAYQVARFLGEFGLTPMSQAKVSAETLAQDEDPLDKLLVFPGGRA